MPTVCAPLSPYAAGRVKTLHPAVHGGILARRDLPKHLQAIEKHAISPIDIVIVNLYPFRQTVTAASKPSYEVRGGRTHRLLYMALGSCSGPSRRSRLGSLATLCPHLPTRPLSSEFLQLAVENIDIGGPAMIRAAAKNHSHVTVVVDPADYPALLQHMEQGASEPAALQFRKHLAWKAFQHTATYDSTVAEWMWSEVGAWPPRKETHRPHRLSPHCCRSRSSSRPGLTALPEHTTRRRRPGARDVGAHEAGAGPALRREPAPGGRLLHRSVTGGARPGRRGDRGEPAARRRAGPSARSSSAAACMLAWRAPAAWRSRARSRCSTRLSTEPLAAPAQVQHHGKEMSYNNYLDADAAFSTCCDFAAPTCVVVKHTNPCGVASRDDLLEAYRLAVRADPISAFGGIVAFNRCVRCHCAMQSLSFGAGGQEGCLGRRQAGPGSLPSFAQPEGPTLRCAAQARGCDPGERDPRVPQPQRRRDSHVLRDRHRAQLHPRGP